MPPLTSNIVSTTLDARRYGPLATNPTFEVAPLLRRCRVVGPPRLNLRSKTSVTRRVALRAAASFVVGHRLARLAFAIQFANLLWAPHASPLTGAKARRQRPLF